jgi:hypothetical protein
VVEAVAPIQEQMEVLLKAVVQEAAPTVVHQMAPQTLAVAVVVEASLALDKVEEVEVLELL